MSLQFSDTSSSKNGLIQECEFNLFGSYGTISGNTSNLATFTRLINNALNRVAGLIMQSDGRWQWDDNNQTDFPISTTNLVTTAGSEQQDYTLSVEFLKILRVEVKNAVGDWVILDPIDQADLYNQSLTDFLKSAGMPKYYDKVGNSIFLYPKPLAASVTASSGLKVFYQRPPSYFTTTDTTKVPGISSLFHRLIALIASRDYAAVKSLPNARSLSDIVALEEDALAEFYLLRNKDEHLILSTRSTKYN